MSEDKRKREKIDFENAFLKTKVKLIPLSRFYPFIRTKLNPISNLFMLEICKKKFYCCWAKLQSLFHSLEEIIKF